MSLRVSKEITLALAGILTVCVALGQPSAPVPSKPEKEALAGSINLQNVPFSTVFPVYTNLCNSQAITVDADRSVKNLPTRLNLHTDHPVTTSEAIRLFENAFETQAGLEIVHASTNQVVLRLQ